MPEFFFHIRLDLVGGEKAPDKKIKLFSTPPQIPFVPSRHTSASQPQLEQHLSTSEDRRVPKDWRAGFIKVHSINMVPSSSASDQPRQPASSASTSQAAASVADVSVDKRLSLGADHASTRARFEPSDVHDTDIGWGVVRLYRETRETPGLEETFYNSRPARTQIPFVDGNSGVQTGVREEDCTTLSILAVPSYFSPTRLLAWVGDKTCADVTHFRMLMTEDHSRYMVLMRFKNSKKAQAWKKEWNGAYFDNSSPETAQVVFVKSIEVMHSEDPQAGASYPSMAGDPLAGSYSSHLPLGSAKLGEKPPAPPTPSLTEMPTCPVCLERMDESSGLLTILCQHVFHCKCLYKWRGTGCPVCRFTHSGLSGKRIKAGVEDDGSSDPNECTVCHRTENLWTCLICGNMACGRYDEAHAFHHWQESGHAFSLDMVNQRIWDYERDAYVHRIVQNKLDGKISEDPELGASQEGDPSAGDDVDFVPRQKTDAMNREYTALLNSQLESQRAYFEDKASLAADKASDASNAAMEATQVASKVLAEMHKLREAYNTVVEDTVPSLERERDRANKRAEKAQEMARKFEKEWREEKTMAEGLHERIKKLDSELGELKLANEKVNAVCAEQSDMLRDLQFFISGQEKLKEMGEEVVDGSVSLPEASTAGKKGGKGKGRKKN